jgi:N-sulfoglucosamine sulfohydrolase
VQDFDTQIGDAIAALSERSLLDKTLIVVTSDNGLPFPRAKATLYSAGTHVPLLLHWPNHVKANHVVREPVTLTDLAPTFLEAARVPIPRDMTGRSLLALARGKPEKERDAAFTALERHTECRAGTVGYPGRAIRTTYFLYIRNFHPERWPAGDPDWQQEPFRDIDGYGSLSKAYLLSQYAQAAGQNTWVDLATAKRPREELFDLRKDPSQLTNVAASPAYRDTLRKLSGRLDRWMEEISDPRAHGTEAPFDGYEYIREPDRH